MGSRAREGEEEMMGTACASGSSGAPTSESITDVSYHSPFSFTSLLSLHPTTQNSFFLFSPPPFSLSMSQSPSPPFILPRLPSLPGPSHVCTQSRESRLCVRGTRAFFKVPLTFSTFHFSIVAKFECQTSPGGQPHNSLILYSAVTRSERIVEL